MTKLEELSELLVSEIRNFEEVVKKLEEIRKTKIQLDLQNLQKLLTEHKQGIERIIIQNEKYLEISETMNKEIKCYFRKGTFFFAAGLVINLCSCLTVLYFLLN
ncbi:hypothetical protein HC174_01495 [Salinimicrobium sp. CDJ15-81-2]|uniref:Uncharacterized protein n=1 Tax=Tamlana crocina TaxID=393006 RepID=A0ABX1DI12_9FLAO|nr:DUF6730 family protein [Tamlana crocina]NJX16956.1 hypothetical protein [Tamlana crocina]NJY61430.1 hypothetical protein [Salinimicrobium nanhaiense]